MDRRRSDLPATPPAEGPPLREPIRIPWLWVAMGLVVLAGVPLYLAPGVIRPLVGGIPFWLLISIAATVAFSALTCWACLRGWNLAEPAEEAAAAAERDAEVRS
ncbi:hypothetical protein [Actinomycetospora straminea]|uniref:DUF3311 domain-containing protein n=1 Tax=Actinomycetospora straminea TaxID=663607 RepID=A0ABP9F0I2_9PSEU|nr:hypothetical protein [Actinomycetospora straminea]MDD7934942.1 hypothetical protein [Actinomycetospora straminea]